MSNYVYINPKSFLWVVGFYQPDGKFYSESDHHHREDAAKRVNYLNGGDKEQNNEPR